MSKIIDYKYIPSEKQLAFHNAEMPITLIGGAVGGGKTCAIGNEPVIRGTQFNMDIVMGRADLTDFLRTTLPELLKWLPDELVTNFKKSHPMEIHLKPNKNAINAVARPYYDFVKQEVKVLPPRLEPTVIKIVQMNDPEKIKSMTVGEGLIDELSGVPEEVFSMMISRIREPSMHPTERRLKTGSNPCAGWVKNMFIIMADTPEYFNCKVQPDPFKLYGKNYPCIHCKHQKDGVYGCKAGKGIEFIPSFIADNDYLGEVYEATLYSHYPKDLADMLIKGSWDLLGGAVFPEVALLKYTEPFSIPPDWTRFMAIDPHTRTPTHVLWVAASPAGQLYIYRELVISDSVKNICQVIHSKEQGEHIFFRIIDTSANTDDALTGLNIMDEFSINGISCAGAAKGNFIGYTRIKDALAENRIHIFSSCPNMMNQWKHLVWDDHASKMTDLRKEAIQLWKKKDDHLFDCLKYIMIAKPRYVHMSCWKTDTILFNTELQHALAKYNAS